MKCSLCKRSTVFVLFFFLGIYEDITKQLGVFLEKMKGTSWDNKVQMFLTPLALHHCDLVRESEVTQSIVASPNGKKHLNKNLKSKIQSDCQSIQLLLAPGSSITDSENGFICWKGKINQDRSVLVKIFNEQQTSSKKGYMSTVAYEEVNILKKLSRCHGRNNVTQLLAYQYEHIPQFYMTEDMHHSEPLTTFINDRKHMFIKRPLQTFLNHIVLPSLEAVEFCHKNDVCLRDLTANSFSIEGSLGNHPQLKLNVPPMAKLLFAKADYSWTGLYFCVVC